MTDLAFGVASVRGTFPRVVVRAGERGILDSMALRRADLLSAPTLNHLIAAGPDAWAEVLGTAEDLLATGFDEQLLSDDDVQLQLPIAVADYVDFYSSLDHATNVGRMFRPDGPPLTPNWRHLPVAYHGRAGTVVVSGTPIRRPSGQRGPGDFGPTRALDVELELGWIVGVPSAHGEPVDVADAAGHIFGAVLLNDWSARDIQGWESLPLGPFLGKSFATSISAWVTPMSALAPARVAAAPQTDPEPLPYLREDPWALDLDLEIELAGTVVTRVSARSLYWSAAQQIAHLTCNGASLRVGDLLGTGTVSGPEPGMRGCLLERSWNGAEPIALDDGTSRTYLLDGDEVVLRGRTADGAVRLGDVRGRVIA